MLAQQGLSQTITDATAMEHNMHIWAGLFGSALHERRKNITGEGDNSLYHLSGAYRDLNDKVERGIAVMRGVSDFGRMTYESNLKQAQDLVHGQATRC